MFSRWFDKHPNLTIVLWIAFSVVAIFFTAPRVTDGVETALKAMLAGASILILVERRDRY
jgi:hypothetical protein